MHGIFGLLEHGINRDEGAKTRAEWHIGYGSFDRIAGERQSGIFEWIHSEPLHDAVERELSGKDHDQNAGAD